MKKHATGDGRVKRTVTAGSAQHAAAAAAKKKAGIDNMLAAIDGPKTISTVRLLGKETVLKDAGGGVSRVFVPHSIFVCFCV